MNELIKRLEELEADVRTSGYFETPACEIADIRASDEGREGIASFLNKRAPDFAAARKRG